MEITQSPPFLDPSTTARMWQPRLNLLLTSVEAFQKSSVSDFFFKKMFSLQPNLFTLWRGFLQFLLTQIVEVPILKITIFHTSAV